MTDDRPAPPPVPGVLLDEFELLIEEVQRAKTLPLSRNAVVDRDELLAKLARLKQMLPEELRSARWMVRKREQYVAENEEKARLMLASAREKAQAMISESSIVREAVEEANTLVRNAEAQARRVQLESEDIAEGRLSEAEAILGELLQEVRDARAEFHRPQPTAAPPESG